MNTPIYDFVKEYKEKNALRLHMPGHKGKSVLGCEAEDITEELISSNLYTKGQPDPDLIIRPSGEYRTSNFLVWQSAYSEYWFSNVLWPDFKPKHLLEAIDDYNKRNRRFGGV